MIKKITSALLAFTVICCCLIPAFGANIEFGTISLKLNSDIAGYKSSDVEKLIEIKSENVKLDTKNDEPVYVADYAGTVDTGAFVAGRTYNVYYYLVAADGYTLPEKLNDGDVTIECGKGVTVYSVDIVSGKYKQDDGSFETYRGVFVYAGVVVDGNIFQRIVGFFHDLILKIKAWSLY